MSFIIRVIYSVGAAFLIAVEGTLGGLTYIGRSAPVSNKSITTAKLLQWTIIC